MYFDIERLIHSFKTAVACIVAYLVTYFLGFASDPWIIITVVVVMCAQIYVGSVLQKAYLRFLGTLFGCILATAVLLTTNINPWVIMCTIAFAGFVFSFVATGRESLSYTGTLGAVTTIIILIGQNPTPAVASARFMEISIGILIATLISQFLLPIHARTHLRRTQAATLEGLQRFYTATMAVSSEATHKEDIELEQLIITSLVKQQKLAKEAAHELLGEKFNTERVTATLYSEREMLRAMTFMNVALTEFQREQIDLTHLPSLTKFNQSILAALATLTDAVNAKNTQQMHIHLPDVITLRAELLAALPKPTVTQTIYADGLLFNATILAKALEKLADLFGVKLYGDVVEGT